MPRPQQAAEQPLLLPAPVAESANSALIDEQCPGGHEALRNIDPTWLFESVPDAMVLADAQDRIVIVNGHADKMFGYRREELVGEPFEKLLPERFRTGHAHHPSDYSSTPKPVATGSELCGLRKDGNEFPIKVSLSSIKTPKETLVASTIRDMTQQKHAEERQSLPEFEKMISTLSKIFINLPAELIDVAVDKALNVFPDFSSALSNSPAEQPDGQIKEGQKRICEALGLDLSTLAQISAKHADLVVTHAWLAEGSGAIPSSPQSDLPWIARMLLDGQQVSYARVDDLPEEAAKDKETLRLHGPKCNAIFPLSVEGKTIGALAFGSLRVEREWPEPLLERLGMAAQIFANLFSRAQAHQELRQADHEIEALKQRLEKENVYRQDEVKLEHKHIEVIGDSECIRRVLKKAEQVAGTDSTALVLGETGTGKELIAQTIHDYSRRRNRVMVKVNCAALPASLVESELFGREKGAFTGALTREIGRFELANGSTILLDEIGELPLELQSKLLRVLQEGEFERLGGPKTIKIDVRVIAATSRNLQQAVREGRFREDLFYRLNVFPITIPPLRERSEDIPALVWHFVNKLSQRMGRSIESIHAPTMEALKTYYWPGNIRELRNVIERYLITNTSTVFRAELPAPELDGGRTQGQTFEEVERNHILHIMELVGWRVRGDGGAAEILGLKPTTLESRMQKLGLVRRK
jgi:formate hydrogenlyase transcriptional activator